MLRVVIGLQNTKMMTIVRCFLCNNIATMGLQTQRTCEMHDDDRQMCSLQQQLQGWAYNPQQTCDAMCCFSVCHDHLYHQSLYLPNEDFGRLDKRRQPNVPYVNLIPILEGHFGVCSSQTKIHKTLKRASKMPFQNRKNIDIWHVWSSPFVFVHHPIGRSSDDHQCIHLQCLLCFVNPSLQYYASQTTILEDEQKMKC